MCKFTVVNNDTVEEVQDTGTICSITLGTATSINVDGSGGQLILENLRGGARTVGVWFFGAP
jgi:hypothetical protein